MRHLYHGTSYQTALMIAQSGFLLSPLEQRVRELRSNPTTANIPIEEIAERFAPNYTPKIRLFTVSMTPNINIAGTQYAGGEGIVLGFKFEEKEFDELTDKAVRMILEEKVATKELDIDLDQYKIKKEEKNKIETFYIQDWLSLGKLDELTIVGYCSKKQILELKEAFDKFNPKIYKKPAYKRKLSKQKNSLEQ